MPLRNVATTFTIEQQRLEINALAGDVNNIATGATNVGTAATANALAAGATGEDLTLSGTLTVNGSQTILNTATLEVEDKNIIIAKGSTTDAAASGGGITLKGADDKTLLYDQAGDEWQFNKPLRVEGSQGYASSASNLETSVTKAAFRVKGSTDSSDSLFIGVESTDANPYIQGNNGIGNNAKKLLLNPYGGNVGVNVTDPEVEFHVKGAGTVARFEGAGGNTFIDLLDSDDSTRCFLGCDGGSFKVQTSGNSWSDKLVVNSAGDTTLAGNINLAEGKKTIFGSNSGNGGYIKHQSGHLEIKNETGNLYWDNNGYVRIRTGGSYTEALRITASQDVQIPNGYLQIDPTDHDKLKLKVPSGSSDDWAYMTFWGEDGTRNAYAGTNAAGDLILSRDGGCNLTMGANAVFNADVSDSKGPIRSVPATEPGNANYTLVASDAGNYIDSQGTGNTITVPSNTFSKGDVVTILRCTSGDVTIAQGSGVTMYHSADGANTTTGNRTLSQRGMATMIFVGPNYCYISGTGLS